MAIITISRGCFSHGQEIAEKVAEILGYECISREVLIEAAKLFNVSEKKLIKSLHDAPTIPERIAHKKTEYLFHLHPPPIIIPGTYSMYAGINGVRRTALPGEGTVSNRK